MIVPNFNGILPALWKLPEKTIERPEEIAATLKIRGVKAGKFEHEQADVGLEHLAWREKRVREKIRIQEIMIGGPGTAAEAWQIWKSLESDLIGDLEGEEKFRRHL